MLFIIYYLSSLKLRYTNIRYFSKYTYCLSGETNVSKISDVCMYYVDNVVVRTLLPRKEQNCSN